MSFGGLADTPLDVTSYNGGIANEQTQSERAVQYANSAADLKVFKPTLTNPLAEAVMLPLPLNAQLQYTQSAQYPTVLGDNALPREWYKVPAQHHLNVWTQVDHPYTQQNFVESERGMQWLAERLYIPAAKKPFKTYPRPDLGEYEKEEGGCPRTGASAENSDSTRQLLFGTVPDHGDHSPPPSSPEAPLDCWPYENPEEQCTA